MPIYYGSRYEKARATRVLTANGERRPAAYQPPPGDIVFDFTVHLVVEGDRLDLLADNAYGDPSLWHVIADANPEVEVPEPLVPGTLLRIPSAVR